MNSKKIVIIDGCRTPFLKSGTHYMDLMSYQLGQFAIRGLLEKTGISPSLVDLVVYGTVIHNIKTPNVARESALTAGIPYTTPCYTVSQACISANRAIASGIEAIQNGKAEVIIAGGTDNTSDTPILFKRKMRKKLFKAQKIKTFGDQLKFLFSLRPSDFVPERPSITEYTTNRTMGLDCEIMANKFQISREDQDAFAVRSHHLAAKAWENGYLKKEVCNVDLPPDFNVIETDNGIRANTSVDQIKNLKPAFDKKHGTLTAANSSFLTDGASAVLIMTLDKANELGLKPLAEVVDYAFSGQSLENELLLGPTYATNMVLQQTGLSLDQMDVIEFHEAFAGQILTNIKCMASVEFAQTQLGRDNAIGEIDMSKFNNWGGSLSIGHPFGATGGRIMTTAANRLHVENGEYALLAACAAGAQGHAMILKKL